MSAKFNRKGNGLLDSENDQSPTSSQFIRKENKMRLGRQFESQNQSNKEKETIEDALIDLYLSVKIRSNEEVSQFKIANFFYRLMLTMRRSYKRNESDLMILILSLFLSTSRRASRF